MRSSPLRTAAVMIFAVAGYLCIDSDGALAQTTVYRIPRSDDRDVSGAGPDAPAPTDPKKPQQCTQDKTGQNLICSQGPDALKGLHWGIGLLYSSNFTGVADVGLVQSGANKIVQVKRENSAAARAAFELHYFIPATKAYAVQWAWGPFVSLNSKPLNDFGGGGTSLSSLGAGLMIGANAFVDDASGKSVSHSVNLGIGWLVDTAVRELAPGVVDGQATTLTQDQLTRTTTKNGFMAILSYNFTLN